MKIQRTMKDRRTDSATASHGDQDQDDEAASSLSGTDGTTLSKTSEDDDPCHNWFLKALETLGHFNPSSVALSYKIDADEPLYNLTLWLEDRIVRMWDLNSRNNLRKEFWSHIDRYLEELGCPESYFRSDTSPSEGVGVEQSPWRHEAKRRVRVVYWLISCAVSEAYGDVKNSDETKVDESPKEAASVEWNAKDFPLGFSTGDVQMDRIMTILRFRFLLQLQDEQARLNEVVAELQQQRQNMGKTKPLKSRRRR